MGSVLICMILHVFWKALEVIPYFFSGVLEGIWMDSLLILMCFGRLLNRFPDYFRVFLKAFEWIPYLFSCVLAGF